MPEPSNVVPMDKAELMLAIRALQALAGSEVPIQDEALELAEKLGSWLLEAVEWPDA